MALAHELKDADVYAVDVSSEAWRLPGLMPRDCNSPAECGSSRVMFWTRWPGVSDFDFVVSNPPYVGFGEADKVQRSVRDFEPQVAVFAGERGLNVIEPLIEQAHRALKANGWLAMEIGYSMRDTVVNLLCHTMWEEVRVVPDLQGIPRVVAARKSPSPP